jgi:hypothetical protein
MAGLWRIDDAVRASGLYDADTATRAAAERLAPTWNHHLNALHEAADALVSSSVLRR